MKKAIVTGANGFIGSSIVQALLKKSYRIYAIDHSFNKLHIKKTQDLKFIECNLIDEYKVIADKIQEDIDVIYHLAWAGTSGAMRSDVGVQLNNVRMACNCVEIAKIVNAKRIIYASSINEVETYEYLMSNNIKPSTGYIYGAGKLTAHLMAETHAYQNNIDFIPVLITNIYGAGENSARLINTSIRKLLKKEFCSFTEGKQIYDFIYIDDAINSIIAIAEKGTAFNCYYIGSGKPKPLREYLLEMRDIISPGVEIGLGEIEYCGAFVNYSQFELDKVKRDTGYSNEITFKQGIEKTMNYIKKEIDVL